MKRAVLSGAILFLCFLSVAQVPEIYKFQPPPANLSGLGNQNQTVIEWYILQPVYLQKTLVIPNVNDFSFGKSATTGIIKTYNDIRNPIIGMGNNITIHHNIEYVPDLIEVLGNSVIWKISQRGLFLTLPGHADLVSGIYFVLPRSSFDNYGPVFQDTKGDHYTLVPGWRVGQYLPILNSGATSGSLEWRYYGIFLPGRLFHTIKTGK
ncbi:MAG TPA: hypothetical protein VIK14_11825 [Ignavibacteria bacterium]